MYSDPARMAEYMKAYRDARRVEAKAFLGGKCAVCGATIDLHFDHIDPATKSFTLGSNWNRAQAVVQREVEKCQLLCGPHHRDKTRAEQAVTSPIGPHSLWRYNHWGCRCDACRAAKRRSRSSKMVV